MIKNKKNEILFTHYSNVVKIMEDTKIFRYKFADSVVEEVHRFAQLHRGDDRHQFKDAWKDWVEYNKVLIETETQRLVELGYQGDIVDKMFKSARYYFRKKGTEKKEPTERRVYVSVSKDILSTVDKHISENMLDNSFTPANGYDDYCNNNKEVLTEWISNLRSEDFGIKDIQDKIKKTYKNRYYVLKTKSE